MRAGVDPRVNQFLGMVNQLEDAARVLPRWPARQVEGPVGGTPGSKVLVNVSGLDLAKDIHGVLVSWCEQIAEERGVAVPDPAWSSWRCTPGGTWIPDGGNTSEIVSWLRRHATWLVYRQWYVDEMWPELFELRRKARSLMGLSRPPRHLVDLAMELATSGRSMLEVQEVARAHRADG